MCVIQLMILDNLALCDSYFFKVLAIGFKIYMIYLNISCIFIQIMIYYSNIFSLSLSEMRSIYLFSFLIIIIIIANIIGIQLVYCCCKYTKNTAVIIFLVNDKRMDLDVCLIIFYYLQLPENNALDGVCGGLIEAWKLFGNPKYAYFK